MVSVSSHRNTSNNISSTFAKSCGSTFLKKKFQISSDNFSKWQKNSALYVFQKLSLLNLSHLWYDFFLFGSIFDCANVLKWRSFEQKYYTANCNEHF